MTAAVDIQIQRKGKETTMKHLLPDQVQRLIEAVDGERNKLLFTMLFEHGLRISEALALTKSSVQRGG